MRSSLPFVAELNEALPRIATMETVKRMWLLRKLYGSGNLKGTGGILPPNDPRLEGLTEEQMELDLLLYIEDHPELKKRSDSYKDTEYEEAMREDLGTVPQDTPQAYTPPVDDWIDEPID